MVRGTVCLAFEPKNFFLTETLATISHKRCCTFLWASYFYIEALRLLFGQTNSISGVLYLFLVKLFL